MSNTTASLRRKIGSAGDLQSVVRSMKALAAANIGQYEKSVVASVDYYKTAEVSLGAYFRNLRNERLADKKGSAVRSKQDLVQAIVFGSDQGLVGRFNEDVAGHALEALAAVSGKVKIWAVGERVQACLVDAGLTVVGLFGVPKSAQAIGPLVGRILVETEAERTQDKDGELLLFVNHPVSAAGYAPVTRRLLPLDEDWRRGLVQQLWPTKSLPEIIGIGSETLRALVREYVFVSLFRACAESLASENASRLAAMQRADKNIDELLETLRGSFHRLRQTGIDEELFDVTAGYEAISEVDAGNDRPGSQSAAIA